MNTPIYVALLVAVVPAAKERLADWIARAALADQDRPPRPAPLRPAAVGRPPAARPRLEAALGQARHLQAA